MVPTPNLRLIPTDAVDGATLTAVPALIASKPASNLQHEKRALTARTTTTADQQIKGIFSSAQVVSACELDRSNLTGASQWRLQLFSDAAWTTEVYDSGLISAIPTVGWGEFIWAVPDVWLPTLFTDWSHSFSQMWFDAVGAQSFILTISDPNNPAGYIEASRLVIGLSWSPLSNFNYGATCHPMEETTQERTEGGSMLSNPGVEYRRWELDLGYLDAGERAQIFELKRKIGLRRQLFISCYPEVGGAMERDHAGLVKLKEMTSIQRANRKSWATKLVFEES